MSFREKRWRESKSPGLGRSSYYNNSGVNYETNPKFVPGLLPYVTFRDCRDGRVNDGASALLHHRWKAIRTNLPVAVDAASVLTHKVPEFDMS